MLVLGIDPGTAITGFGLVQYERGRESMLDYGTIRTSADLPMYERLLLIYKEINAVMDHYHPQAVAIEEIFHHRNAKSVISVAQSRGVLLMAAASKGLEIGEYTPLQVKQAVCGYGGAEKKQVQMMVQKILKMDHMARPDDAADALALAICHLHSRRLKQLSRRVR